MAERNFVDVLAQGVRNNWDKNAFSDYEGDTFTYEEVAQWVARFHILFERKKVQGHAHSTVHHQSYFLLLQIVVVVHIQ